jgi:predicted ATPase
MKKYVVTGGPGVGKTTTINDLKKNGFYIVSETAREIIEKSLKENSNVVPWIDLDSFNREVIKEQGKKEKAIPKNQERIFLDRGIVDALAYYDVAGKKPIPELTEAIKKVNYEKVFILDRLPIYINDEARKEDNTKAEKIHKAIIKAYKKFNVFIVPVLSVKERTKWILNKI